MGKLIKKNIRRFVSALLVLIICVTSSGFEYFVTEAKSQASEIKIYLKDNTVNKWISNDNATIEAVDNSTGHVHYKMVKEDNTTWSVKVPETAYNFTFNRLSSDGKTQWNSWSAGGRDGKNIYYVDGSEYGHWEYAEESQDKYYFHAGDVVYLDLNEFLCWENDKALIYVNFSDSTKENNGRNDVNIPSDSILYNPVEIDYEQEKHIYAYVVTKSDEGKDKLRFWRGNTNKLWNASIVLEYSEYRKGYNCINVTNWEQSGYLCKKNYKINLESDKDLDGISDYFEAVYDLDKCKNDTDGDGISDYNEIVLTKTDPRVYDSEKEGLSDGRLDLDNDGIDNENEIKMGTNPILSDTDDDGLTDYEEVYTYNTDPLVSDTDNDELDDGDDVALKLDPLVSDTDGNGIIDGKEYVTQSVNDDRYEDNIRDNNLAKPMDIVVTARGNVNSHINIKEYNGCLKGDERSYVGKIIEISGSEINAGSISFMLDKKYQINNYKIFGEDTNGLVICYSDGENTIPLETTFDEDTRRLSACITNQGIYYVMDVMNWFNSLGLDYSSSENIVVNDRINSLSSTRTSVNISNVRVKGQADIVFIVDTTGSMGYCVDNVKDNINAFVDEITSAGINSYFALVEYKDILCDGKNSTNVKKSRNESNWFSTSNDFKEEIEKLGISGGGDEPESLIDALEMARRLDMRKTSQKFFIVVTDAGFKIDNNYDIQSMDEMIDLLIKEEINVSVVSNSLHKSKYDTLYKATNGVFADIQGYFKDELFSIADKIKEETNNGCWIALEGLPIQYVKLKEKPTRYSECDTDGDTIFDWNELDDLNTIKKVELWPYLAVIRPDIRLNQIPKDYINVYGFTSNPVKEDTDDDGLLDGTPVYVDYTNTKGIVEKLKAAPKDPNPKIYTGEKNLWKTHIASMKTGKKLATEDSDKYYMPDKPYIEFGWSGWHPTVDTNIIESFNSLLASGQSLACDFRYDAEKIALHSYDFQWQVIGGYNDLYDWLFEITSDMDKRKLEFENGKKEYAIWAWKGNYSKLGPGSEVAVYEKNYDIGLWYFSDFWKFSCSLYQRTGEAAYSSLYNWYPQEYQWWTTGFVPDEKEINHKNFIQITSIEFPTKDMYDSFRMKIYNSSESEILFDDEELKVWLVW